MNHYPLEYSAQLVAQGHAGNAGAFHSSLKRGHEDRDSQSPSEDGSAYFHYPKSENELEGARSVFGLRSMWTNAPGRGFKCLSDRSDPQHRWYTQAPNECVHDICP